MALFKNLSRLSLRASRNLAIGVGVALALYYPIGMVIVHTVHDGPEFEPKAFAVEGGSASVAMAAGLLDRELGTHWAPNDPFFFPGGALTRMPAFQRGLLSGVARFSISLADNITRTRGSSSADADIQKAVGLFNYPPTVWIYDSSVSWLPTASSESQYKSAIEALKRYNERLSAGKAVFEPRADNLMDTLDRMAADLGSSSGSIDQFVEARSIFALGDAARLYYENKGKMVAYFMLMHGLEKDFSGIIKEKKLEAAWAQTMHSLQEGMELSRMVVLNGRADGLIFPSHLAAQGFYLLRARTQLREITDILLK